MEEDMKEVNENYVFVLSVTSDGGYPGPKVIVHYVASNDARFLVAETPMSTLFTSDIVGRARLIEQAIASSAAAENAGTIQ